MCSALPYSITNTDLLHLLGNANSLKKLTLWRSSLLSKRGLTPSSNGALTSSS